MERTPLWKDSASTLQVFLFSNDKDIDSSGDNKNPGMTTSSLRGLSDLSSLKHLGNCKVSIEVT